LILIGISPTVSFFNTLNWFLILANSLLASILGVRLAARVRNNTLQSYEFVVVSTFCFLACLFFYPILKAYTLGQAQVWINFLFALACVSWFYEKKYLTGAVIGLICLIKPQFFFVLIVGLYERTKKVCSRMADNRFAWASYFYFLVRIK
jgi:alpha-1,2-mannosyltransferase